MPGEVAGVRAAGPRRESHSIWSGPRGFLEREGDHGEVGFGPVAGERGRGSPDGHAHPAWSPDAQPGRWPRTCQAHPGEASAPALLPGLFLPDSHLASPPFTQVSASRWPRLSPAPSTPEPPRMPQRRGTGPIFLRPQPLIIGGLKVRSSRQAPSPAWLPQPFGLVHPALVGHSNSEPRHLLWLLLMCSRSRVFSGAGRSTGLLTCP